MVWTVTDHDDPHPGVLARVHGARRVLPHRVAGRGKQNGGKEGMQTTLAYTL